MVGYAHPSAQPLRYQHNSRVAGGVLLARQIPRERKVTRQLEAGLRHQPALLPLDARPAVLLPDVSLSASARTAPPRPRSGSGPGRRPKTGPGRLPIRSGPLKAVP